MSFISKLKNRIEEVSEQVTEKMKDNLVDSGIAAYRMDICNECPSLIPITKNCKECGCFMTAKTKLKNVECPLKKW